MIAETDFYWFLAQPSVWWLHFCGIEVRWNEEVFMFFSKMTARICTKFFSGFKRKHFFSITCCEKLRIKLKILWKREGPSTLI